MTRIFRSDYRDELRLDRPDPFPVHRLDRVERPTTFIDDNKVKSVDERDGGFYKAGKGQYGENLKKEYKRFVAKQPLSGALCTMAGALGHMVDEPSKIQERGKTPWGISSWAPMPYQSEHTAPGTDDPTQNSKHIKETAYFLRSDIVGICKLPPYAVFSHSKHTGEKIDLNHKYAISIVIDQDWRTAAAFNGNDWISNAMSFVSYSTSGFIACILADYIRRLGYPARAHHAMNYQVVVPPILLWSGIGEMSRMGDVVLNPFLGPRYKAAVVTTDMPLDIDRPIDFGLQDFCNKCGSCAEMCPSQAISYGDKVMHNGYEKWSNDVEKCTSMRVGNPNGSGCGTCVKACPWNKPFTPFHRTVNWTMRKFPSTRRFGIWCDKVMGYHKPNYEKKWWLDLDQHSDGKFFKPKKSGFNRKI
ncbi:MAG: reductive dehalogenase [Desulfobacteraceae bacterium]|nr:reductive dehalogenase [Desulfobacteraceae bacterium]